MGDLERVRAWIEAGRLLPPSTELPNTVDLARVLAERCGVDDAPASAAGAAIADAIPPAEHYVFVLVDGLGLELLERRLPPAAFLRRQQALELRAVFPSTTAAALTSLATGEWPASHGVPAWWTYLPEWQLTATVLPFIERFSERPLTALGLRPERVFVAAPLLPRYKVVARSFLPRRIADSVYSTYVRGETPVSGYGKLADGVAALQSFVCEADAPTFSYLYTEQVDAAAHNDGPEASSVLNALTEVDGELARLANALDGRARIIVSADHGMLSVPEASKSILRPGDPLLELLIVPPFGEPRVPFFLPRPDQGARFQAAFRERFGNRFALLTREEAAALRLFGPVPPSAELRGRFGEFIALAAQRDVLIYQENDAGGTAALRGYHAGLTPAEMRVPLIVA